MELEGSLQCSQKPAIGSYLSQIHAVNATPLYSSKIHFNIILPLLGLHSGLFPYGFPINILYAFLSTICATCLAQLIHLAVSSPECRAKSGHKDSEQII
jgi:hypothetical protein